MRTLLAVAIIGAVGCHLQPGATTMAAPAMSRVHVTLVDQSCQRGDDLRDLVVDVRIDNPTASTLHVDEDSIRLKMTELTAALRAPHVIDVPPRSSVTIPLVFRHHAVCEPDQRFAVAWNDALIVDGHPVEISNLMFSE